MAGIMSEVVPEHPHGFDANGEQGLKALHIGVFTVAGRHVVDVELEHGHSVLDLRRAVRRATGLLTFQLVSGASVLGEAQTLLEAGLSDDRSIVQIVVLSSERFASLDERTSAGLYLLPDGAAEVFVSSKRVINWQEDEEHTQRLFWGHWSAAAASDPSGEDVVLVVLKEFENNVFNEAAMSGWTSRSGRAALPADISLVVWRQGGRACVVPDESAPTAKKPHGFPDVLEFVPSGEECMFDAWHLAGTSTIP